MVRLFNVYYPIRTLVLVFGETVIVCASFILATLIRLGQDSVLVLEYENGLYKVLAITGIALLCFYYFDLYDTQRIPSNGEMFFRIFIVLGILSLVLAAIEAFFPGFLLGNGVFLLGLLILTLALVGWRWLYGWLLSQSFLRERVYVLGSGDRAKRLVEALRKRPDLGLEVVGWAGAAGDGSLTREQLASQMLSLREKNAVDHVIVAMSDGRGKMPVRELLDLRLSGVKIDDATGLLEKISGKIEVHELNPSWLIFSEGFRLNYVFLALRRVISVSLSLIGLIFCLPLIPFIVVAIKVSSPGPVLYRQRRVGQRGRVFTCYKFRTMRADAEADTGATWAADGDPRITSVGRILRYLRLDEIPQMWNVLKGDMGFIGPRPERPEFVQQLSEQIPYYNLRHIIRPGITGWAQIRYKYGNTVEDARQKLQYDLFYIKNMSIGLDFWIFVQTIKVILLGRGAQ
ncbi:MAG TPA: TIGR03013 family XrtA/PEP-CTERM system glycosyltransferase [Terriglobia bacterium]|nr:TIGR03013 family XrtA/PEP-CTERM system glycosyltransferase [Terriglobia bacterium]